MFPGTEGEALLFRIIDVPFFRGQRESAVEI